MIRCPLSALLTAALGTAALFPVMAQGTAAKAKPATPPAAAAHDDVVGTCNSHKLTWAQFVTRIKAENETLLGQSAAAYIATRAQEVLFGKKPQSVFTITKDEAIAALRMHPNPQLSQQLEFMLTQLAVDDAATKEGVQPTPKEVDARVADVLKGLREGGQIQKGETDEHFLAAHNVTLAKLKASYRPQVQLVNLIRKDTTRQLGHAAGPADLVQASHILVAVKDLAPTATEDEKKKADAEALTKIKGILADIRGGKIKFEDAAKANSDDPGSKDKGGDLGIFMKGMMLKEFENSAFSATPGQVTEPVKTSAGYHIILVTKSSKQITAAEAKAFIAKNEQDQIQSYLSRLMGTSNVENRLQKLLPPSQGQPGFGARPQR